MNLYKLEENDLIPIHEEKFELEREIQNMIENNCDNLFNLKFICSEFKVGEFRLDTLAFNEESQSFVIIEYKNNQNYSVIDQGFSYLSVMLDRKAEFVLKYNEVANTNISTNEVNWTDSKIIFISPSFTRYQKNSINFISIPFELYQVKKFNGNIISLERIENKTNNRFDFFSDLAEEVDEIIDPVTNIDEDYHKERTNEECKELWENLKEYFLNLGDTSLNIKKHYISIKKNNRAIFYTQFLPNNLRIHVLLGYENQDGSRRNGFFEINDPTELGEQRESLDRNGIRTYEYTFTPTSNGNSDYLIAMLKQKYDALA